MVFSAWFFGVSAMSSSYMSFSGRLIWFFQSLQMLIRRVLEDLTTTKPFLGSVSAFQMRIPLFSKFCYNLYVTPWIRISVPLITCYCLKDLSILFKISCVKYVVGNPGLAALLLFFGSRIRFFSIASSSYYFSYSLCALNSCSLSFHFGILSPSY